MQADFSPLEINEKLDYGSRSSIYLDFDNLFRHFGLTVSKDEENPERRGREVVYRIVKED